MSIGNLITTTLNQICMNNITECQLCYYYSQIPLQIDLMLVSDNCQNQNQPNNDQFENEFWNTQLLMKLGANQDALINSIPLLR
ncbi:hypothetical protein pb186bvf_002251 [Paramecium bursaria]